MLIVLPLAELELVPEPSYRKSRYVPLIELAAVVVVVDDDDDDEKELVLVHPHH